MALMHQMLTYYNALPEDSINHAILTVMFRNIQQIPELSIERTAELCMTSTASVSRLVRSMGFRNYTDFRGSLRELLENYPLHNRSMPHDRVRNPEDVQGSYLYLLQQDMRTLQREFDHMLPVRVAEMIRDAAEVALYALDVPTLCVEHLQYDLVMSGKRTKLYATPEERMMHGKELSRDSLVLVFAGRNTPVRPLIQCLESIREMGAKCALITTHSGPLLEQFSDLIIQVPSSSFAVEVVYYHIVLTFITMEYRTRYVDRAAKQK